MTTIVVTGGAGFIGSNFIRYWLATHDADLVVNYDALTYAGTMANLEGVDHLDARYVFEQADIRDQDRAEEIFKTYSPDCVVNFAAESHNSRAVVDPGLFYETNVIGTQRLLEAARRAEVPRFHHISTCEVYGELELDSAEAFSEDSPYRARTPYSSSKAGADLVVRAYHETFGIPTTISNCSNNFGPYQFPEKVIPLFTVHALQGRRLPVYKSNLNRREWLHVEDHCRAIDLILQRGVAGETYNVGSGSEATIEDIANAVLDIFGLDDSFKSYVADRPGHDKRYLLDSTKLRSQLGWSPTIPFQEGLRQTITWYADHSSWWEPLLARAAVDEDRWDSAEPAK